MLTLTVIVAGWHLPHKSGLGTIIILSIIAGCLLIRQIVYTKNDI